MSYHNEMNAGHQHKEVKHAVSKDMPHMSGKMMMSTKEMDKEMESNINNKKI